MRRSSPRRGLAAALAAGSLAVTGVFGSSHREAPRIMLDPAADNTDVYAFTAPDAPGSLTVVANWIPLEEPAGGPYFGKLDPRARYYVKIDNTGDGYEDVAYRWQFKNKFRNPNSFLYARPTVTRSTIRTSTSSRRTTSTRRPTTRTASSSARSGSATTCRWRPDNVGPKTIPNYDAVSPARSRRSRAAARRSSARSTTRSSSTSAPSSTASTSTSRAGRTSASATRAAARTTCRATTRTRSCCRSRSREVTRDGKSGHRREGHQRRRRRVGDHRAPARVGAPPQRPQAPTSATGCRSSRLGNPLINEVVIPIGAEGQVQPDVARRRPGELRQVRPQPRAGPPPQRPVQPGRQGDQPHGHRPGAADRRARADPDRPTRPPADTLKLNLGVPPGRHREPLRRARR